jgi:tetrahydromethanopterin S-methyltransferase subunit C
MVAAGQGKGNGWQHPNLSLMRRAGCYLGAGEMKILYFLLQPLITCLALFAINLFFFNVPTTANEIVSLVIGICIGSMVYFRTQGLKRRDIRRKKA